MHVDIVTLEETLFSGEVESLTVPGTQGKFQILNNHAAIMSTLKRGQVKLSVISDQSFEKNPLHDKISQPSNSKDPYILEIEGGVIELYSNKATVLVN